MAGFNTLTRVAALLMFAGTTAGAQLSNTRSGVVTGFVVDSVSRSPLAEATVQLIAADNPSAAPLTALSDEVGRYTIKDVASGRYKIGFIHPLLDSLGVEAPLRDVVVGADETVRADLNIPSPAKINTAICGARASLDSASLIIGVVRNAQTLAPIEGAKVSAQWLELSFKSHGLFRNTRRISATTGDNGWFAMCNVPNAGTVSMLATHNADSTDMIELQVPPDRFMRREIYLGPSHSNMGRLIGTVIATVGGKPLTGAQVSIAGGPQTRTNESGGFTLVGSPVGSRMLEVHALGFYPERRRVDVVKNAPPIHVSLVTLKSVLDTVKILAKRLPSGPDDGAFQQRRKMGIGHFLTPQDVMRFAPLETSDLFRLVPGVRYTLDSFGQKVLQMRGAFAEYCDPAIFINGADLSFLQSEEIDHWVHPNEVAGIEVYTESNAPPQFQHGLGGCGSIVIWTK